MGIVCKGITLYRQLAFCVSLNKQFDNNKKIKELWDICMVANVKNRHLQNNLLIQWLYVGQVNSHQNTAVVVVTSIASLGWKSIEIPEKYEIMKRNSRKQ